MLSLHTCAVAQGEIPVDLTVDSLPPEIVWIDMHNATEHEIAFVERVTGVEIPTFADLSEIETSSRLYNESGTLYLSTPVVFRADSGEPISTPLGFVLNKERLITVRFEALNVFKTVKLHTTKTEAFHQSSAGAFVGLVDATVDRMADVLERVGADLDKASRRVFGGSEVNGRPAHESDKLRDILRQVARDGDLASKIRDSLLGLARIVPYVANVGADWLPSEMKTRLKTSRQDIASLADYDTHLSNKIQFLLDATLGLINIEQNQIIRVLTIVSVVGVPPTFVSSMYGMNFKFMPELEWTFGYPYALILILLSAIAPILWFKLRGWL